MWESQKHPGSGILSLYQAVVDPKRTELLQVLYVVGYRDSEKSMQTLSLKPWTQWPDIYFLIQNLI